jgi:hypothetical protein
MLYLFAKVPCMDMRTLLKKMTDPERETLARAVDSSVGYLRLIAGKHRRPSTDLAKKLVAADGRLTLHELRPDVWVAPDATSDEEDAKASVV